MKWYKNTKPNTSSKVTLDYRRFLASICIMTIILILDLSLGNSLNSGIKIPSAWGVPVFALTAIIYIMCHYFIVAFTRNASTMITHKTTFFRMLNSGMYIVQFVFAGFIIILVYEIIAYSEYSTALLNWSSTISYGFAGVVAGSLAHRLFWWYNSNGSFVVLIYAIASAMIVVSMAFTIAYNDVSLLSSSSERDYASQIVIPFYSPNSTMGVVQYVWAVSNAVNYFMLWIGTVTLLRNHWQRVGKIKLWIIFSIPLISLVYQYTFAAGLTQVLQTASHADPDSIFMSIFGNTLPGVAFGIMFGVPFWIVARTIPIGSLLRNYMVIASLGLVFLQLATTASVYGAAYPPFGLVSVLTTALSTYLILIGIYYSAVSISQDSKLRQSIRLSAMNETGLLDSIGTSHMIQELERRVIVASQKNSEILAQNTGVRPALSDDDIKIYLHEVIEEIKRNKIHDNTESKKKSQ